MKITNIIKVEIEAARLLAAIKVLREVHAAEGKRVANLAPQYSYRFNKNNVNSPKHTGAVKRASMDLTRALAELRANKL